MKFDSLAKRAFLLISLCCLTTPAIAGCSDEKLKEYLRLDDVLEEYHDYFDEVNLAFKKFNETNAREDAAKFCQTQRRSLQLSQEWLSLIAELEKACPIFYNEAGEWDGRNMFNTNQPLHQREVDACEANGL